MKIRLFIFLGTIAVIFCATSQNCLLRPDSALPFKAGSTINTVAYKGDTAFIGGIFDSVGGKYRKNLVAIDLRDYTILDFSPIPDGTITSLFVANEHLYIGGRFQKIDTSKRTLVAEFDLTSGKLTDFAPKIIDTTDIQIRSRYEIKLIRYKNELVVSGSFTKINNKQCKYIASIDLETDTVKLFPTNAFVFNHIRKLFLDGDNIYLLGLSSYYDSAKKLSKGPASFDLADHKPLKLNIRSADHYDIAAYKDDLFFCGYMSYNKNGFYIYAIEKYNKIADSVENMHLIPITMCFDWGATQTEMDRLISAISVNGDILYLGGNFTGIQTKSLGIMAGIDLKKDSVTQFNINPRFYKDFEGCYYCKPKIFSSPDYLLMAGPGFTRNDSRGIWLFKTGNYKFPINGSQMADTVQIYRYSTTKFPKSRYSWDVSGGDIISGNATSEILVKWKKPTLGNIILNVTDTSIKCPIDSSMLSVTIYGTNGFKHIDFKEVKIMNPVQQSIRISGASQLKFIELITIDGKLVKRIANTQRLENLVIDEMSLNQSVYLIRMTDSKNNSFVRRIVLTR